MIYTSCGEYNGTFEKAEFTYTHLRCFKYTLERAKLTYTQLGGFNKSSLKEENSHRHIWVRLIKFTRNGKLKNTY